MRKPLLRVGGVLGLERLPHLRRAGGRRAERRDRGDQQEVLQDGVLGRGRRAGRALKVGLEPRNGTSKPDVPRPRRPRCPSAPTMVVSSTALTPAALSAVTWAVRSASVGLIFCSTSSRPALAAAALLPASAFSPYGALVVDVADLVALGQSLGLHEVADRVDHLDVVRGADDHDVRVGQQVGAERRRHGGHLVGVDVLLQGVDDRRAEQFVQREHLVADLRVRRGRTGRRVARGPW